MICIIWMKTLDDALVGILLHVLKQDILYAGIWFNFWIKSKSLGDINTIETKAFAFTYKEGGDYYGSSSWNSPLWIRPEGLKKSPYKDGDKIIWSQIFGHTETIAPNHWIDNEGEFYCIDCINEAYLVEILNDQNVLEERILTYV